MTSTPNVDAAPHERAGLALGFVGVASFSLTLPMARIALGALDPVQVAVWRGIVAAVAALLILLAARPPLPKGGDWGRLCLCALGVVFGFPFFSTLAMATVSAAHGAVVVGLLPLATAVAGAVVGGERPSKAFWLMSLIGTALTLTFVLRQAGGALAPGHAYLLAAVAAAAIGYAYGGLLARTLGGWQVSCWTLVVALPALAVLGLFIPPVPLSTPPHALAAFLYLALVSQLSGFFAWYRGMALAGIARVSQLQLLQLFMTLLAAWLLLGEAVGAEVLVFGTLVAATVRVGTGLRVGAAPNGR
ncbi:MAG: DMT family transporter [Geminicoccaceae bacterium]|nr:DMT family transporter [Geminicoccaceae bacterium]